MDAPIIINQKLWWQVFDIPVKGLSGNIECNVLFELNHNNQKQFYYNDNYRTSSHNPLKIFISSTPLPKFDNLYLGDCHSHSNYTDDQVEFGAPIKASIHLCRSLGLSFLCATDHSYDLDDTEENYLSNDPNLFKWKSLQQEIDILNSSQQKFTVVRGEEVTCRNFANQNVHLILLGNRNFFSGKGDGAERWFKTQSEYSTEEIIDKKESSTLAYAAHPSESVSLLQRLLLNRGKWLEHDISNPKLTGIQFANGQLSKGFKSGYQQWIKALLQGKRIFLLAGNDAHGNFNRFRQVGIPFFKINESQNQIFGKMRTGVFLDSLSEENILNSLRLGISIITDGPIINLRVISSQDKISSIGNVFKGTNTHDFNRSAFLN